MINVVFLLLIFFLMSARIAPPEPFETTPPTAAEAGEAPAEPMAPLHVAEDGRLGFREARGEAALLAASAAVEAASRGADAGAALPIRADAELEAAALAALLRRLAEQGVPRVEIAVTPR
ncbi:MAG: biopolymer transporter ExbD [Pseudomonadota bacterium]